MGFVSRSWGKAALAAAMAVAMAAALVGGALPAAAAPALGHTYTVNSTLDEIDSAPGDGVCLSTPSGVCTLRAAIMEANVAAGPNIVTVPSGTFTLTRLGFDDTAQRGDLDITANTTVRGAGSGVTIVNGNGGLTHDRVFHLLSPASSVTLSGMTIRNGQVLSATAAANGGGVDAIGVADVQLNDVVLEHNQAYAQGGGLFVADNALPAGSTVIYNNLTAHDNTAQNGGGLAVQFDSDKSHLDGGTGAIYRNTAALLGGGVFINVIVLARADFLYDDIYSNTSYLGGGLYAAYGPLVTLEDSRLHGNYVTGMGGGIYTNATLTVTYSTLDGNLADTSGAGLVFQKTLGQPALALVNSTVTGNQSAQLGGGLYVDGGSARLLNTTIDSNAVNYHTPLAPALGAGVYFTHEVALVARNSILANNWSNGGKGFNHTDDCSSDDSVGSLYYNLFTTMAHCTILVGGQAGNFTTGDPLLGPLQANGGATPTQALLDGSPALDAADPAGCTNLIGNPLISDQRLAPRPVSGCDIGAYERVPEADLALSARASPSPVDAGGALTYTYVVTNTGPTAVTSVYLMAGIPLNLTYQFATASQGHCGLDTSQPFAPYVSCNLDGLASGAHATVTVHVAVKTGDQISQNVTASSELFDPVAANNSVTLLTVIWKHLYLPLTRRS